MAPTIKDVKIFQISASNLVDMNANQLGVATILDGELSFKMWGARGHDVDNVDSGVVKFLAKDKPARVYSLQVSNLAGIGVRRLARGLDGTMVIGTQLDDIYLTKSSEAQTKIGTLRTNTTNGLTLTNRIGVGNRPLAIDSTGEIVIGSGAMAGLVAKRVLVGATNGTVAQDSNFVWDSALQSLCLNTTPSHQKSLDVYGLIKTKDTTHIDVPISAAANDLNGFFLTGDNGITYKRGVGGFTNYSLHHGIPRSTNGFVDVNGCDLSVGGDNHTTSSTTNLVTNNIPRVTVYSGVSIDSNIITTVKVASLAGQAFESGLAVDTNGMLMSRGVVPMTSVYADFNAGNDLTVDVLLGYDVVFVDMHNITANDIQYNLTLDNLALNKTYTVFVTAPHIFANGWCNMVISVYSPHYICDGLKVTQGLTPYISGDIIEIGYEPTANTTAVITIQTIQTLSGHGLVLADLNGPHTIYA